MKRVNRHCGFALPVCGKGESEGLSLERDSPCKGTVPA
jgi:hypothetical protein